MKIIISFALSLILTQGALAASSPCKGLNKASCTAKSQCTWVDSYKRKDGVKVSAHCRSKAKKSSKTSKNSKTSTKASTKKNTSKDKKSNTSKSRSNSTSK